MAHDDRGATHLWFLSKAWKYLWTHSSFMMPKFLRIVRRNSSAVKYCFCPGVADTCGVTPKRRTSGWSGYTDVGPACDTKEGDLAWKAPSVQRCALQTPAYSVLRDRVILPNSRRHGLEKSESRTWSERNHSLVQIPVILGKPFTQELSRLQH